jgi:DNA repair protein RadA/Sms
VATDIGRCTPLGAYAHYLEGFTTVAKERRQYQCESCGHTVNQWAGQCQECESWNSFVQVRVSKTRAARSGGFSGLAGGPAIVAAADVELKDDERILIGIGELDRVLGGGLVPGSVVLIGGDPGIGKSTLLLQALSALQSGGASTLYVTGEESLRQVMLRARRTGVNADGLRLLAETNVETILGLAAEYAPTVLVVDSIQTTHTEKIDSAPGGVAQVRESAAELVRFAKSRGTALFLVGHVTKEGALAGPRVLEHMVDTVLYFESESSSRFRVIRATKNRFGAVNELGIFAMTDTGLRAVENPSAMLLSRGEQSVSGSVVMVTREGTRPLLVEVQALVDDSSLGNPRRVTVGLEQNRLAMLLAVLNRHGGIATQDQDVFVNVVGGVRVTETGADLPTLLTVLSSLRNRELARELVVFGEVGLTGEVRPVSGGEERLREAAKHGFTRAIVAQANAPRKAIKGLEVMGVTTLADALEKVW